MTMPPSRPMPPEPSVWAPRSLRWAVFAALAIGLCLPAAVNFIDRSWSATRLADRELERELNRYSDLLAVALVEPLWQISSETGESLVRPVINDPRFISVTVHGNGMGMPFIDLRNTAVPGATDEESRRTARPIVREGQTIGRLTLTMTRRPYLEKIQGEIRDEAVRWLITLVCSLAVIHWVIRRRVLSPMARLAEAADALAAGRLEEPLRPMAQDEIGRVGLAMERMRTRLLAAFGDLREHASTLEEKVDQRTAELRQANDDLRRALSDLEAAKDSLVESEKQASLGRLVAGVAHELNTPLGNALTVVSTLEEDYARLDQAVRGGGPIRKSELLDTLETSQAGHELLRRNVERAATLVRDFKQVATDQTSEMRRRFDLATAIEEVLVTIRPRFKHTPFVLRTELAEGLMLDSYPGPLGQVLTNLILNALIHGLEGREQGEVLIACRGLPDGWVEISCSDDGVGMAEDVRRRAFDPFFTTRIGRGGSGLGLSIVHNIATRLLGGRISVSSAPGSGSRFELLIPAEAPIRE